MDSDLSASDDDAIATAIKGGRVDLFEILIQRYERRIFSFIMRMVNRPQDAEELAQDCFVRAYGAIGDYQTRGRFASWLFTIARNLTRNHMAKKAREGKVISQGPLPEGSKSPSTCDPRGDEIQELLAALPEEYRSVMTMKYIAELGCREIAGIEGISEDAVKQRLHRAREMIRDRLEGN